MRQSRCARIGLAAGTGILIMSAVCLADDLPVPSAPPNGTDLSGTAPLPPQVPMVPPPAPPPPVPGNLPQGAPNLPPAAGPQASTAPATDEEFPAAAGTDRRKVQRFMNRIRELEMRMAMLERRLSMMPQAGYQGGYPGGMQGAHPGGMQGGPGSMPPGRSGPPGFFGGNVRPRGLSEEGGPGSGSPADQPSSSESGSSTNK
jgi:hypothetical protein